MKDTGKKINFSVFFILPKSFWFWPYSLQNTKAAVKYILGKRWCILKDNSIHFDSIDKKPKKHVAGKKVCTIKNRGRVIFVIMYGYFVLMRCLLLRSAKHAHTKILSYLKSKPRHRKFTQGKVESQALNKMIQNSTGPVLIKCKLQG